MTTLLTACVLFCLTLTASGLLCKQCYLNIPKVGCLLKATECEAKDGQMCVTGVIKKKRNTMYKIHGCTLNVRGTCKRIKKTKVPDERIIMLCCKSEDFCNK